MAESCTIYCKVVNQEEISRLLHSHFPTSSPVTGDVMVVHGSDGSLRLTQKQFREPGDEFCRMILGICTFIETIESADAISQQLVVNHLVKCDLAIGVVAEPGFDADERFHAVVFAIAKALDGVVFNGQEMLDANGVVLVVAA